MTRTLIFGTKTKILCVLLAVVLCSFSPSFADTMVRFDTAMGNIHVQLSDTVTPLTVQNFLNYVNDGDYVNSFFHRLVPGFILQGGGFTYEPVSGFGSVPGDPPVLNEPYVSNTYGTIAMAKVGPPNNPDGTPGTPTYETINSATSQFFFNLGDNSANLDDQNGGFTVFGEVVGTGMGVVELLASQQVWDASGVHSALTDLPLIDYQQGEPDWPEYMEMVYAITVVIEGDANNDGVVSAGDYAAVQANFGNTGDVGIPGDANFDGVVSAGDYASVQANFGNTAPTTATPTPEPATMALLAIGGIALLRQKKRKL